MDWRKLKEFCNNLPEEELDKKVILWREEEAITEIEPECLSEDYYIDSTNTDYGSFPLSEAKAFVEHNPEDYPKGLEEFTKVHDKGSPFLMENL